MTSCTDASYDSLLRLDDGALVHGVKYVKSVSLTWCVQTTFSLVVWGARFVRTAPTVTCMACLANPPTYPMFWGPGGL